MPKTKKQKEKEMLDELYDVVYDLLDIRSVSVTRIETMVNQAISDMRQERQIYGRKPL